jgi:hypothetical protein
MKKNGSIVTITLAAGALFAAIVSAYLSNQALEAAIQAAKEAGKQAGAAVTANEMSQKLLIAQNRPWVGPFGDVEILSPVTFDATGATLTARAPIKNTGNSFAKNTVMLRRMIVGPLFQGGIVPPSNVIMDQFGLPCRDTNFIKAQPYGALLLPNATWSESQMTWNELRNNFRPASEIGTNLWIAFCIAYKDQFDEPHGTFVVLAFFPENQNSSSFFKAPAVGTINGRLRLLGSASDAY